MSVDCTGSPCTVDAGTDQEGISTLMNTASEGVTDWNQVTMNFTATAAAETLSFLAWGDGGSTENLPPTVFLAGVNSPSVPEPASLSLLGAGALGLAWIVRRRRPNRNPAG